MSDCINPKGDSWENTRKEIFSTEEIAQSDLRVSLIGKLIEAREQKGITQEQLAEMTGLKQSAVARLERMTVTPKIDTIIKVLQPLGYTLEIVPTHEKL